MAHLRRAVSIPLDHLEFEEVIDEFSQHVGTEERRNLELALAAIARIEKSNPGFVKDIGTDGEPVGEATLTFICQLLERAHPGRVQQILGKTKLGFWSPDRIRIHDNLQRLSPGWFVPFAEVWISPQRTATSAFLVALMKDNQDRSCLWCMLFRRSLDDVETFKEAEEADTLFIYADGTISRTPPDTSAPAKKGFFGRLFG